MKTFLKEKQGSDEQYRWEKEAPKNFKRLRLIDLCNHSTLKIWSNTVKGKRSIKETFQDKNEQSLGTEGMRLSKLAAHI